LRAKNGNYCNLLAPLRRSLRRFGVAAGWRADAPAMFAPQRGDDRTAAANVPPFQTTYTRWHPHIPHLGEAAHDAARRDDISWISLIRTARVSYAFQAIVAAALLLPPQMRDMLAALTETHNLRAWLAFPASMAVFGFLSWYWARATLSARFDLPDTRLCWDDAVEAGLRGDRPYVRPRPLHIVPQAPIPIAGVTGLLLAFQSGAWLLGVATLACLMLVWFGVSRRQAIRAFLRRFFMPNAPADGEPLAPEDANLRSTYSMRLWLRRAPYRFAKILQRAPSGTWPASLLLLVSVLAFTVTAAASFFPATHLHDPRNLIWTFWHGPTPVLLGCALMIGPLSVLSFMIDGLRLSVWIFDAPIGLSRPPVMFALLIATALAPNFAALHALRIVNGKLPQRPTLAEHWAAWQRDCGAGTRPIVVSISGGAARAGLWGAAVLAQVDAEAAGHHAAVYAISTVSGGSLGAATYLSARAANPGAPRGTAAFCQLPPAVADGFAGYAKRLNAADAIGPLLAGFVLSDVPRGLFGWLPSLLGAPMRGGDRAAAIERAFEANAARAAHATQLKAVRLDSPYLSLSGPGMPLWAGLATERDTGRRVLIVPVRGDGADWPFQGAADLLAQLGADIPISTAINATARFPFLEPSGAAPSAEYEHKGLTLIDGGYYDQSGLETALELADWLRAHGAHPIVVAATGSGYGHSLEAQGELAPSDDIVRCGAGEFRPDQPPMTSTAADVLAPLIGLYHARSGHVDALLRRARAAWCTPAQSFFHFYLGPRGAEAVPLNWVLSDEMADHIWRSAGHGDADGESNDLLIRANRAEAAALSQALKTGWTEAGPPRPPVSSYGDALP
jgi:hypothetical protein